MNGSAGFTPFPVPPSPGGTPRALLYAHDRAGLGHVRRTLAIAGEIGRRRPDAAMLLVTGAPQATAFALPPRLDVIRLPWLGTQHDAQKRDDLRAARNELRSGIILETVRQFDPHLVLIDFMPGGPGGELLPALEYLRAVRPDTAVVLGLRDILGGERHIRRWWRADGYYELLELAYHRVLVYGTRDICDVETEYGFPPGVMAKTTYTGLLRKPDPVLPAGEVRARLGDAELPLIVVTVGSGADGDHIVDAYLRLLRAPEAARLGPVVSFVVTGPSIDPARDRRLRALAAGLPRTHITTFTPDLLSYLHAADLIVAMGGFSSVYEALAYGKRLVVVPRIDGSEEQLTRARRLEQLGLLRRLPPSRLQPSILGGTLAEALAGPPPDVRLDFGGLERVGEILTGLLERGR